MECETHFTAANDLINIVCRQRSPVRTVLEYLRVFRLPGFFKAKVGS